MKEGLEKAIEASRGSSESIKSGASVNVSGKYITGFNVGSKYSYDVVFDKAKSEGVDLTGLTLYLTHEPHRLHARKIGEQGIAKVVYIHDFNHRGRDVLRALGVEVLRIDADNLC